MNEDQQPALPEPEPTDPVEFVPERRYTCHKGHKGGPGIHGDCTYCWQEEVRHWYGVAGLWAEAAGQGRQSPLPAGGRTFTAEQWAELEQILGRVKALEVERDALLRTIDLMQPVVDAAEAFRDTQKNGVGTYALQAADLLDAAVDTWREEATRGQ